MDRRDVSDSGAPDQHATGLMPWKRVLDLAVMLVLSPGLLILGGGVALLVLCGSRGPVFFRQRRVGYKGREFDCFKFRTMQVNAETSSHRDHFHQLMEAEIPMTKLDAQSDPRLVPFGSLLRVTGLDELPQLINVVRGEMSIVGPRPPLAGEVRNYNLAHLRRLDVTPGITGLWQVQGRQDPSFASYVSLDVTYIENWSVWLDFKIIMRTIGVVFAGTGT